MNREDPTLEALLERNRDWANSRTHADPNFFGRLAREQDPKYFWIGCSDSPLPANQILGLQPGEVFVHENLANVVVQGDSNCMSATQFAIDVLSIRHIIVCGHYGCSGVQAALYDREPDLVKNWLRRVQEVRDRNQDELREFKDDAARMARLCELNVLAQAVNLGESTVMRTAWARGRKIAIHALIYGLENGILENLGLNLESSGGVQSSKSDLGW
jgi:carbonic anhydrase